MNPERAEYKLILFIDPILRPGAEFHDRTLNSVLKIIYSPGNLTDSELDNVVDFESKTGITATTKDGLSKDALYSAAIQQYLKEILGPDAAHAAGAVALKDCIERSSGGGASAEIASGDIPSGDLSADVSDLSYDKPLRILTVGDSHSAGGTYGSSLGNILRSGKHDVYQVAVGGIAAFNYYKTPKYDFYFWKQSSVKKGKPVIGDWKEALSKKFDVIIISLGTNDSGYLQPDPKNNTKGAVDTIKTQANNIQGLASFLKSKTGAKVVFWVGAPSTNASITKEAVISGKKPFATYLTTTRIDDLWEETSKLFGKNAIDSRGITRAAAMNRSLCPDGFHPNSKEWAPFVVEQIKKRL